MCFSNLSFQLSRAQHNLVQFFATCVITGYTDTVICFSQTKKWATRQHKRRKHGQSDFEDSPEIIVPFLFGSFCNVDTPKVVSLRFSSLGARYTSQTYRVITKANGWSLSFGESSTPCYGVGVAPLCSFLVLQFMKRDLRSLRITRTPVCAARVRIIRSLDCWKSEKKEMFYVNIYIKSHGAKFLLE